MLPGQTSRPPAELTVHWNIGAPVGRVFVSRDHRRIAKLYFTESGLSDDAAPVVMDVDTHILSRRSTHVDRWCAFVRGRAWGLSQLYIRERGPCGAVERSLDGDVLCPNAKQRFHTLIVVPDFQAMQLIDLVQFVLNPNVGICGGANPHVGQVDVVLSQLVQTGTVDRFVRRGIVNSHTGGRGNDGIAGNHVEFRFHGEAPDIALENGLVRCGIDFIDTPVIGLAQCQAIECHSVVA